MFDALPSPDVLAASIVEDLQTAQEQFMAIAEDLGGGISVSGEWYRKNVKSASSQDDMINH